MEAREGKRCKREEIEKLIVNERAKETKIAGKEMGKKRKRVERERESKKV